MAWDFSTDPEWAEQLAWVEALVRSECEPIDLIVKESHDLNDPVRQALIPPLQQIVKDLGLWSFVLGLVDGPTEVHKVTLARLLLKDYKPAPDVFPSEHLLRLREAAEAKFADKLAGIPRT